jgi:hypothetical protein
LQDFLEQYGKLGLRQLIPASLFLDVEFLEHVLAKPRSQALTCAIYQTICGLIACGSTSVRQFMHGQVSNLLEPLDGLPKILREEHEQMLCNVVA